MSLPRRHHRGRSGGLRHLTAHPFEQSSSPDFERCLVAAHARTPPTGEDKSRDGQHGSPIRGGAIFTHAETFRLKNKPLVATILSDVPMVVCFLILAALLFTPPARGEDSASTEAVTSQVRADRRTGRLIRRVVVPENVVIPRVVEPLEPGTPAPQAGPESRAGISGPPALTRYMTTSAQAVAAVQVSAKSAESARARLQEATRARSACVGRMRVRDLSGGETTPSRRGPSSPVDGNLEPPVKAMRELGETLTGPPGTSGRTL